MNEAITKATAIAEEAENAIVSTHDTLVRQIEQAVNGLTEVKAIVGRVEGSVARMKAAAKELEAPKRKKPKSSSKANKPSVKKEDVQPVCLALAKKNPNIAIDALEGMVEDELVKDKGFSRNGAKMQINKCLGSDLFIVADDGSVSIAQTKAVEVALNGSAKHGVNT